MNATELATLSIKELKSTAQAKGIDVVVGDKRSKATWILAIESWQIDRRGGRVEAAPAVDVPDCQPIESPFELVIKSESLDSPLGESVSAPTPQSTAPNQQRGASIVVLVIATLLSALLIVMGMGLRSLTSGIAAVVRLSVAIWQSIPRSSLDPSSIPINYFLA
jgi:hypothetical protein